MPGMRCPQSILILLRCKKSMLSNLFLWDSSQKEYHCHQVMPYSTQLYLSTYSLYLLCILLDSPVKHLKTLTFNENMIWDYTTGLMRFSFPKKVKSVSVNFMQMSNNSLRVSKNSSTMQYSIQLWKKNNKTNKKTSNRTKQKTSKLNHIQ